MRRQDALRRAVLRCTEAQRLIAEALTLEELDVGRRELDAAWAEIQAIVRQAKRDAGLPVRPVEEAEEARLRLLARLRPRPPGVEQP